MSNDPSESLCPICGLNHPSMIDGELYDAVTAHRTADTVEVQLDTLYGIGTTLLDQVQPFDMRWTEDVHSLINEVRLARRTYLNLLAKLGRAGIDIVETVEEAHEEDPLAQAASEDDDDSAEARAFAKPKVSAGIN